MIQAKAVAICSRNGRVLVERGKDFYRAIGGTIEVGERAVHTVVREYQEEYGLAIVHPQLLGVLENLFVHEGVPHHEIVFVFSAELPDDPRLAQEEIVSTDTDGLQHIAVWLPMRGAREAPLYPEGITEYFRR